MCDDPTALTIDIIKMQWEFYSFSEMGGAGGGGGGGWVEGVGVGWRVVRCKRGQASMIIDYHELNYSVC